MQIEISKAQREAFLQLIREMNGKIRKPRNSLSIYQLSEVHFLLDKSDTCLVFIKQVRFITDMFVVYI